MEEGSEGDLAVEDLVGVPVQGRVENPGVVDLEEVKGQRTGPGRGMSAGDLR